MQKNALLSLLALLFVTTAPMQAQEWDAEDYCCYEENCCWIDKKNYTAKLFIGNNFLENTNGRRYNIGYVVAGSVGYSWQYGLRFEGEYAYRRNRIRKIHFFGQGSSNHGHFQTSSFMANVLWDLPLSLWGCSCWNMSMRPFIGAGIGYDHQHMHSSNSRIVFDQKWHHFSWQFMAGLAYPLFCDTELSFEYRYHQGGCHFRNHSLGIGILYRFNWPQRCCRGLGDTLP